MPTSVFESRHWVRVSVVVQGSSGRGGGIAGGPAFRDGPGLNLRSTLLPSVVSVSSWRSTTTSAPTFVEVWRPFWHRCAAVAPAGCSEGRRPHRAQSAASSWGPPAQRSLATSPLLARLFSLPPHQLITTTVSE